MDTCPEAMPIECLVHVGPRTRFPNLRHPDAINHESFNLLQTMLCVSAAAGAKMLDYIVELQASIEKTSQRMIPKQTFLMLLTSLRRIQWSTESLINHLRMMSSCLSRPIRSPHPQSEAPRHSNELFESCPEPCSCS